MSDFEESNSDFWGFMKEHRDRYKSKLQSKSENCCKILTKLGIIHKRVGNTHKIIINNEFDYYTVDNKLVFRETKEEFLFDNRNKLMNFLKQGYKIQ